MGRVRNRAIPALRGVTMEIRVTYVTTALPPVICGVGDYSLILAEGLREYGICGSFIVGRYPGLELPAQVDSFDVKTMRKHTSDEFLDSLERAGSDTVLLHFSGYGYARRGLCFWLPQGLGAWKRAKGGRRVLTIFHELYAVGPPWRSSFWTSAPQRWIARELATVSDEAFCSREDGRCILARWLQRPVHKITIFSNVGEVERPLRLSERPPLGVVFGQEPLRRKSWEMIERGYPWLKRLGIKTIIDIGPGTCNWKRLAGISVEVLGALTPEKISEVLSEARLGIVAYDEKRIASSGTIAAYIAHGCAVLNLKGARRPAPRVLETTFVLVPEQLDADAGKAALLAHRAYLSSGRGQTIKVIARHLLDREIVRRSGS